jgi:hypothetical protein
MCGLAVTSLLLLVPSGIFGPILHARSGAFPRGLSNWSREFYHEEREDHEGRNLAAHGLF